MARVLNKQEAEDRHNEGCGNNYIRAVKYLASPETGERDEYYGADAEAVQEVPESPWWFQVQWAIFGGDRD